MGTLRIIKASAGTGKTYTLTREIITHYLQYENANLENFLLITFTRNAAEELLNRFYEHDLLPILTSSDYQKLNDLIKKKYHHIFQKFEQKERKEWKNYLRKIRCRFFHDLLKQKKVLIGTVDSILSQLSKQLFVLAGVTPDWESALQFSFEEFSSFLFEEDQIPPPCLQKWLKKEKDPYTIVKNITEGLFTQEKKRLFLFQWDLTLHQEYLRKNNKNIHFSEYLEKWINDFYKTIIPQWQKALESNLQYIKHNPQLVETPNNSKEVQLNLLLSLSLDSKKIRKTCSLEFDKISKKVNEIEKEVNQFLLSYYFYDKLRQYELKENRLSLASQREYLARYNSLLTSEPLYQHLGIKIAFAGWDEFQDTSYLQYYLFYPLLHELYSTDNENFPNVILFVGDIKQAIYAWRNSEPEIMAELLQKHFSHENIIEESLNQNYRSSKELLKFFSLFMNSFLKRLEETFKNHTPLKNTLKKLKNYGYDALLKHRDDDLELTEQEEFCNIFIIHNKEEKKLYQQLARFIQSEHQNGIPYEEMLILVRKNDQINHIEETLKEYGIPVMPAGKRQLENFLEVQWLYYLARYLLSHSKQEKQLAKLHLLAILSDKKNASQTIPQNHHSPTYLFLLDDENEKNKEINNFLNNLFQIIEKSPLSYYLPHLPLIDFFERLIEWTKQVDDKNWFCFENEGIQSFFSKLLSQTEYKFTFINQFLDQFPLLAKQEIEVDTASHAVPIMTIHKAKGLESRITFIIEPESIFHPHKSLLNIPLPFDLIHWLITGQKPQESHLKTNFTWEFQLSYNKANHILCFQNQNIPSQKQKQLQELQWHIQKALESDIIERMNLLYVAITRAKEKIYFFVNNDLSKKQNLSNWKNTSIPTCMKHALLNTFKEFIELSSSNKTHKNQEFTHSISLPIPIQQNQNEYNKSAPAQKTIRQELEWQSFSWRHQIAFVPPHPLLSRYNPEALQIGIMVHRYLAQANEKVITPKIKNPTIKKAVMNAYKLFKDLNLHHYLSNSHSNNEKVNVLFEFTFITKTSNHTEIEILRPDLVILDFNTQKGWIIDFKCTSPPLKHSEQHIQYEAQVRKYHEALQEYYRAEIKSWESYLFYLEDDGYAFPVILK